MSSPTLCLFPISQSVWYESLAVKTKQKKDPTGYMHRMPAFRGCRARAKPDYETKDYSLQPFDAGELFPRPDCMTTLVNITD